MVEYRSPKTAGPGSNPGTPAKASEEFQMLFYVIGNSKQNFLLHKKALRARKRSRGEDNIAVLSGNARKWCVRRTLRSNNFIYEQQRA